MWSIENRWKVNSYMNRAIITVAGVSSRFNENEEDKVLKCIYSTGDDRKTILYSILRKCEGYDKVVIVGGYQYERLLEYINTYGQEFSFEIESVYNSAYEIYGSGYSLWKGLEKCLEGEEPSGITFIEGDLCFDAESFEQIKNSEWSCVSYNHKPIYSNKAVVAYINQEEQIKYVYNISHGLLQITEPFSMLMNSGQMWKFADWDRVKEIVNTMSEAEWQGTNLVFVEKYFAGIAPDKREIIAIKEWENCNTREDYLRSRGLL